LTGDRVRIARLFCCRALRPARRWTQSAAGRRARGGLGLREDQIDTTAWQLRAAFFLTGEGVIPGLQAWLSVSWTRHLGLELVARYHELKVDDAAFDGGGLVRRRSPPPAEASTIGVGLGWYLNQNVKWVSTTNTSFDGGNPDGGDRGRRLTRFALSF
jgi:hypothetical protein